MKVTTARLVGLAALGTLALACNPDTDPVGPALPSFEPLFFVFVAVLIIASIPTGRYFLISSD